MLGFVQLINVDAMAVWFGVGLVLGTLVGLLPALFTFATLFQRREDLPAPRNLLPRENLHGLMREVLSWGDEEAKVPPPREVAPGPYPQHLTWSAPTERVEPEMAPTFALEADVQFLKKLEEAEEEAWAFQCMFENELSI